MFLELSNDYSIFAAVGAKVPTQEKKRIKILANKEILRKSQIWAET